MYDKFHSYDPDKVKVNQQGTIATVIESAANCIYCKLNIPNVTEEILTWKFKCQSMKYRSWWGIAIDAMQNPPNYNEADRINYMYKADGDIWECGNKVNGRTSGWYEGDIVTLLYKGSRRELSIYVNGKHDINSVMSVT